jgi:beta-lactamase class A
VTLTEDDLNFMSGTLAEKGAGYTLTIKELLEYLIKESDNTALRVLQTNFLTTEDILESRLAMGLPIDGDHISYLGPKQYSNILRALYYSAYLRRTFSELALSIMSETDYNTQIPAGVPKDIPVSHKVGYLYSDGINHYHDCGIIYHPQKPYILCIMSTGADEFEADRVMSKISSIVYKNVDKVAS